MSLAWPDSCCIFTAEYTQTRQHPCCWWWHVVIVYCVVCEKKNCLTCKAIHVGQNCKEYQDDLKIKAQNNADAKKTQEALEVLNMKWLLTVFMNALGKCVEKG